MDERASIDRQNETWWNELCGSAAAQVWGITDHSPPTLRRFDNNFFDMYPYLDRWIDWDDFEGRRTLEVGLGYGSVTQRLASFAKADLTAMDIAPNPVAMARHRFSHFSNVNARAIQGNILQPPDIGKFERIVAIGCLHHTGDLAEAINVCYDLLLPGGKLIGMVYHTFSHRQWWQNPVRVGRHWLRERRGYRGTLREGGNTSAYDHNSDGSLAPSTEFSSIASMQAMCSKFNAFEAGLENTNPEGLLLYFSRDWLLKTWIPRRMGLDLYWIATR
jgi:SAM-dependent methyltransferase